MISKFFIEHPVLANVLAIVIVLIGAVAVYTLPVSEYPNVVPPTVQVTTRYPGASPQTVIDTVALPIELQVNGVDQMLYMQSTSAADGTYTLTVTFNIGTDPNIDQVLVQNRVNSAMASLPEAVQAQGVTIQKKNTAILQIVTLDSPDGQYDSLFMSNYATINLVNDLARLPGVGNVTVFGASNYAMRIWLDPNKLYSFGLEPKDVINAVRQQSQEVAAGQIGMPPAPKDQAFQYTIDIQSRMNEPAAVRRDHRQGPDRAGRTPRPRQGCRAHRTWRADLFAGFQAERAPGAGIAIFQTPEANSLAVAKEVKAKMKELGAPLPAGLHYSIPFDTTIFVQDFDLGGLHDALPGRRSRADRDPRLPAEFPRHAGAGDDGSGHHHRRLRRHGGARLHRQSLDALRHRAGHRHRRRRRHRHRRGRLEIYRAGHERP